MNKCVALAALISLTGLNCDATDPAVHEFALPGHGVLVLHLPDGWKDELRQPPDALPPTVRLTPKSGAKFQILITPLWQFNPDHPLPIGDALRAQVRQAADLAQAQAGGKIELRELQGASGAGYFFTATDPTPKPDEFKYMTQGSLRVGDLQATFTILTNDGQESVIKTALEMLKGAMRQTPDVTERITNMKAGYSLAFPKGWKENKSKKNFTVEGPGGASFIDMNLGTPPNSDSPAFGAKMIQLTSRAAGFCDDEPATEFELSGNGWIASGFHCNNSPTEKEPDSETIGLVVKSGRRFAHLLLLIPRRDWKTDRERYFSFFRTLQFKD